MLRPLLLVDDEPDNLELTERLIKKAGIENPVLTASSGKAAIDLLRHRCVASGALPMEKPALVLLDVNMSGMSGLDVLEWLRGTAAFRDVKVVMWTSSADENDERRARDLKADAYLLKFPNSAILGAVVRGCIEPALVTVG